MSELPTGWTESPLGELVEILDARRIPLNSDERKARIKDRPPQELFPYYGATGQVGTIDGYLFQGEHILLGEDGVPFFDRERHKAYRANGRFWVNNHAHVLKAVEELSDSTYIEGFLNCFNYEGFVTGSTRLKLTQGAMRAIPVKLAPYAEQKRIADKLNALLARADACRERLDRIPTILKRFRQSVLAAATSGSLTEDLGNADTWSKCLIGEVTSSSFYGPRFGKNEYSTNGMGVPTIRTTDMTRDGRIEIDASTPRVNVPQESIDKFKVRPGDLLITRTGSIGVMAVFDADYLAIPSAYLIRFRFCERILSRFAFYCLTSPRGQNLLGLSSTAITQPNINAEAIKKIKIELPSIGEQTEIVRRVEALFALADRLEQRYKTARAQVDKLTPALLAKAFRGELVPQDPNDEPASVLLDRIRAERAAAGTTKPKRGRKARERA